MPQLRHIVSADDFTTQDVEFILDKAMGYKSMMRGSNILAHNIITCAFEQPSTRTWSSFCAAALGLGASVLPIPDAGVASSFAKDESFEDTGRILSANCDLLIMRLKESGTAARVASTSTVPFINAGDGTNEHPTQALLDFFTIWEAIQEGQIPRRLRIHFFGDNARGRTVHSLALMLAKHASSFDIEIRSMSFGGSEKHWIPPAHVTNRLPMEWTPGGNRLLDADALTQCEVLYLTRDQTEHDDKRIIPVGSAGSSFVFSRSQTMMMPSDSIIMHPLPRNSELSTSVDTDPRAWYFKQADNGVPVRMALLRLLLRGT